MLKKFYSSQIVQMGEVDRGNVQLWNWTNNAVNYPNKNLISSYKGSDVNNTVYVPRVKGKALLQTSVFYGSAYQNSYYNKVHNIRSIDLQRVPYANNSMANAFRDMSNLRELKNISPSTTNMYMAFKSCPNFNYNIQLPNGLIDMRFLFEEAYNFNQNIRIPSTVKYCARAFSYCNLKFNYNIQFPESVTDMDTTFHWCTKFNQNIKIPNNVISINGLFRGCINFNQNVQIPNKVTNMAGTFGDCYNFNQNIKIPNSVTNMVGTFDGCNKFNQSYIQIPNKVTNMYGTFNGCMNLQGRIDVLTTELICSNRTFYNCNASKPKKVYIYYRYANGDYTKTYNQVKTSMNSWSNSNGVTVYDLGQAPW